MTDSTFDAFVQQAWADHADDPQTVAKRIDDTAFGLVTSSVEAIALARLITHVFGEHLGQWHHGIDGLQRLDELEISDDASRAAVRRSMAALSLAGGWRDDVSEFSLSEQVQIHCVVATAQLNQHRPESGLMHFDEALALAQLGFEPGDPAVRALAVTSNNLACALESLPTQNDAERGAMLKAATTARQFWQLAGGWLEIERAEYRLSRAQLKADNADAARWHAEECLALCEENDAGPLELFFGHEALALALRALGDGSAFRATTVLAQHCFDRLDEADKSWCQASLAALMQ